MRSTDFEHKECITRDLQIIYPHPNETANRFFFKIECMCVFAYALPL